VRGPGFFLNLESGFDCYSRITLQRSPSEYLNLNNHTWNVVPGFFTISSYGALSFSDLDKNFHELKEHPYSKDCNNYTGEIEKNLKRIDWNVPRGIHKRQVSAYAQCFPTFLPHRVTEYPYYQ